MKTRQEIKAIAKTQFKANYWNCVLAVLLVSVVLGVISVIGSAQNVQQITSGGDGAVSATLSVRAGVGGLLSLLLSGPLTIGLNFFFVKNYIGARDEISVTTPFSQAFTNYPRKLGGSLWMALFIFLWSLLFIIPGIIKTFSYSMTEFILADCPNVKARDALKLSKRIMKGHKGELFVLYLSFIGWGILTALTVGILGIFYTGPYMQSTFAGYYLEVREEALRTGAVTIEQLSGTQPV